jgi:hypothetical protein
MHAIGKPAPATQVEQRLRAQHAAVGWGEPFPSRGIFDLPIQGMRRLAALIVERIRYLLGSSAGFTYVIANGPFADTETMVAPFASAKWW